MSTTQIASLFAGLAGRAVLLSTADGQSTYKIAKLSDKLGKLKDGSQGEYVVLSREGNDEDIITIHPNQFKRLATKGEDNELKLVEVATAEAPTGTVPSEVVTENAPTATPAEAPVASATTETAPAPATTEEKPAAPAAPKAPSKKELAVAMFKSMTAEGKARKDIIASMKTIGLTDAGAATYYQNIKSGAWK